jgi:hypothetical protein
MPIYLGESAVIVNRLETHIGTILNSNIPLSDLTYKFIALPHPWVLFAEDNLIHTYNPVWNKPLTGFGCGYRDRAWTNDRPTKTNKWAIYHSTQPKPSQIRLENPKAVRKIENEIRRAIKISQDSFLLEMARINLRLN